MRELGRVLVANRGEIAVRVLRACADEELESVAALSAADMDSLPAFLADRAVCIGPAEAAQSYLRVEGVVAAALGTGCDAVHPGYGFLSERPELAQACEDNGLVFVGPPAEVIRRGGDKIGARAVARSLGVPVGSGSLDVPTTAAALAVADDIGYPVLLKAAAGGGGKGMFLVGSHDELASRFDTTASEARQAFGDDRIYLEHYVANARHVEVQVLADRYGSVVHLGERDCSYQRRYQKLLEEAPASDLDVQLRGDLYEAAVTLMRGIEYVGAGTVEFIVDLDAGTFSFLEVNTRIQVEHPVTEMITGIDIVREQLRVAGGARLAFSQADVELRGHAIECRINAERPREGFRPDPGRLERWVVPQGSHVRVDSHCFPGYVIPPFYDSLLAKVITVGADREEATRRMAHALRHLHVEGVQTTVPFHQAVLDHQDFGERRVNTRWVEETLVPSWAEAA